MTNQDLVETPERIYGERGEYAETVLSQELGEKYVEYRKKWVKASSRELVTGFPLYIQIEHLGRCNLRCPICIQGIDKLREDYTRGLETLDMELYEKVLAEAKQYNCPSMAFHNNDEPLLLSDIAERISLAKQSGFVDLIITTNATLLTPELAGKLLESGLTKINFSVGAYTKEEYDTVRPGGDFNTVLKNIEYFLEEKKRRGLKLPITRVSCVLTKYTTENMGEFRKFWEDRVDVVEFQNFQAIKGYTEEFAPKGSVVDRTFTCNAPWQQVVIRPNGDVLPCCSFYGTEMVIGNIKEESLYNIWNGARMKKLREELFKNNFSISPACAKCSGTFYTL